MEIREALEFLKRNHRAVLATARADGGVQMSPVLTAPDEDGRALISSTEDRAKTLNIRRDPRVWLCVMTDRFFGAWIQVEGRGEILSLPDAMEPLVDYYRRVQGEHPDWDEYREAMERERRVLIRVDIERVTAP